MKKNYITPEIQTVEITAVDILAGSDVIIDGSDLFGPEE